MKIMASNTLQDILGSMRSQPGRFGLSLIAISVGILSLVALIAILGGLTRQSEQIVSKLGANVVGIIAQKGGGNELPPPLRLRHASLLADNIKDALVTTIRLYNVPTLGTNQRITLVATDEALINVRQWRLYDGRFIDREDLYRRQHNTVISKRLSDLWKWEVGNVILLGNLAFNVVGIVEVAGGALDTETGDSSLILGERVAFVPHTLPAYWLESKTSPSDGIDAIFLRSNSSDSFIDALSASRQLLSQPNQGVGPVSWMTPESLIRGVDKLRKTISITVGSIALLSLVLGGMVMMSLMVANVRDRVSEIGLRLALGARQRDIAQLFVLEAAVITITAGVLGTISAHLLLAVGSRYLSVPVQFGLASILIPLATAILLGIGFAYWPARMAARISPTEALRGE